MVSEFFGKLKAQFARLSSINKFSLAALGFLVWLAFFDSHSLKTQYSLSQTINKLEKDKQHYADQLQIAIKDKEDLETNMEKFAREKFLMHKDNEEVIIIQN